MQQHGDAPNADDSSDDVRPDVTATSRQRRSRGYFPGNDDKHPVLITEAEPSLEDQRRARVRRYTIIMAFRIPCLVLAAIAYSAFGSALLSILIILASIPLPWIAVLIANDRPPRRKDEPSRWDRPRRAIEATPHHVIEGTKRPGRSE
ncbi:DUF3099 domain-containing protein [Nocardia brevicatena]|uniref:DUF3099 domain-containing protein n=1 Tax=Nocardia brevicatena TaxID=37327 RepID=UPI0002F7C258|nr:DUF3099 domain-containing protein [Nocardia brevicatena]